MPKAKRAHVATTKFQRKTAGRRSAAEASALQIRTILLPTDFSRPALEAAYYAVELARMFGAKLHLFHAYHFPPLVVMPQSVAIPTAFWSDIEKSALERLERLRSELDAEDLDIELAVRDRDPGSAIAQHAEEIGADLIVMGTRGLTGIRHVLLGSTAERALRLAPCPVITLKESASRGNRNGSASSARSR